MNANNLEAEIENLPTNRIYVLGKVMNNGNRVSIPYVDLDWIEDLFDNYLEISDRKKRVVLGSIDSTIYQSVKDQVYKRLDNIPTKWSAVNVKDLYD